ncbi:hypothetical protein EUTSA_v10017854mg [Eutrema salsugineum]|uniref:TF-B3 domain-containing protein n=1 Tax=Eutrema salsugineum TaxID=72664 RepID=V4M660_EUTSA|nr:hypothetical protein EUTSA_v10017854mg [Eutrema salsugineum]
MVKDMNEYMERVLMDGCEGQQNPNRHDTSSPSLSSVESNEPIRAELIKLLVKRKSPLKEIRRVNESRRGIHWVVDDRRWNMNTSFIYVLCSGWNKVVNSNKLKEGQIYQAQAMAQAMAQLQAQDPAQAVTQPQAQDPDDQAVAQALAPAIAAALSSSLAMAPVVTRQYDELNLCEEERNRSCANFPKRRKTTRVCVPAPTTRDSSNLGQSMLKRLDLDRLVRAPLEAVQETNRRISLLSDTDMKTLDLLLRL